MRLQRADEQDRTVALPLLLGQQFLGQGNRISELGEKRGQVGVIPSSALELTTQGTFGGILLHYVHCQMPQHGEVSGPLPNRLRSWSSFITTSSRQCNRFSTPQCERTTSLKRSADSGVLSK